MTPIRTALAFRLLSFVSMTARDALARAFENDDVQIWKVERPQPTDDEIARTVRSVLDRDPTLPGARIRASVAGGVVILEGDVDFWSEREAAGAVRNLEGVRGVINKLNVLHSSVDELPIAEMQL